MFKNRNKKLIGFVSLLVITITILSACAAPTPQVIEKEVVVEKPVVETVIVETERVVEKPVVETVIVEKERVVEKSVVETVIVEKEVAEKVGWSDKPFVVLMSVHPSDIDPMGPGVSTVHIWAKWTLYETLLE